jgi:hypothetical protein
MRIYNRQEFMKLPAGTFFAKGKPWYFEAIDVKDETCVIEGRNVDFFVHGLTWVEANDSGEAIDRLEEMKERGDSYPMQDSICRDGCFDEEDIFLVYEKEDLERIKIMLEKALTL